MLENPLYIRCVSEDMECRWVTNRTEYFETCSCNPRTRSQMLSDQMLCTTWAANGATRTTPVNAERFHKAETRTGAVQRRETTSLIWMHTAEAHQRFDLKNAKAVEHVRFKGERLVI